MLEFTSDPGEWREWTEQEGVDDVYFSLDYARIWEAEESGQAVGIRYASARGTVLYPLVRIPLDALGEGAGLCDLRTPYDFGGPLALGPDPALLLAEYSPHHRDLVRRWNAVTEFARLHPFAHRALPSDAELHAQNFFIDLSAGYDAVAMSYHGNQRNFVRVARRAGVEIEIRASPPASTFDVFFDMYRNTMAELGAAGHYFFGRETLRAIAALEVCTLAIAWHAGSPVASALFLRSGDDLFYFLSSSRRGALHLRPNNLLLDEIARHGISLGCARVHLGGGSPGLRHFKSQIGPRSAPYSVLRRIHRPDAYDRLCAASGAGETALFPAYRELLRGRLAPGAR